MAKLATIERVSEYRVIVRHSGAPLHSAKVQAASVDEAWTAFRSMQDAKIAAIQSERLRNKIVELWRVFLASGQGPEIMPEEEYQAKLQESRLGAEKSRERMQRDYAEAVHEGLAPVLGKLTDVMAKLAER